jgi:hypothetical protein
MKNIKTVPEMRASLGWHEQIFWASKKLVTGPNGIMMAQIFCDIFFYEKKGTRYQYINSFQINWFFLSTTLKFILSLVSHGLGGGSSSR